jgi:secreted Zn-dependent insulinase-like peptidase
LQSSAFGASHLSDRIEVFIEELLLTILPDKCNGDVPPTGDANDVPSVASEFTRAVTELAKSKLEKPKTLGELMSKWWSEVAWDLLEFDRQAREVEELRKIGPEELRQFAERVLLGALGDGPRRKAVIAVVGSTERDQAAKATAGNAEDGPEAAAGISPVVDPLQASSFSRGGKEAVKAIQDFTSFKKGCEVYPNVAAAYRAS